MNITAIDELQLIDQYREDNIQSFLDFVSRYDKEIAGQMRARGFKRVNAAARTVIFPFGEVTFSRSRWQKGKQTVIPVDDRLGLAKSSRYSRELLFQIGRLALYLPYRKVVQVVEMMYHVSITKDTVLKAVKLGQQLLEEKEEYRYYKEEEMPEKIQAKTIYLEGDGVWARVTDKEMDRRHQELAHFVIHTGSQQAGKSRKALSNKKEIIAARSTTAKEAAIDYLYNHFEIKPDTCLVTNSDMGKGYGYAVFRDVAQTLKIRHHEHFWDSYHVKKLIQDFLRPYPEDLTDRALKAIEEHDRQGLDLVLDTTESLLPSEDKQEAFLGFKKRLQQHFQFTKPPHLRSLPAGGIGVMESQHRKITYRCKNRGMYWSSDGVLTVGKLILLDAEDQLRDLFFGEWRQLYEQFKAQEVSAHDVQQTDNQPTEPVAHQVTGLVRRLAQAFHTGKKCY